MPAWFADLMQRAFFGLRENADYAPLRDLVRPVMSRGRIYARSCAGRQFIDSIGMLAKAPSCRADLRARSKGRDRWDRRRCATRLHANRGQQVGREQHSRFA